MPWQYMDALCNVPEAMHLDPDGRDAIRQWVCSKFVENLQKGKPDKIPIDVHSGRGASSTDPSTWGSFWQALQFYRDWHGKEHSHRGAGGKILTGPIVCLGFVLTPPWIGLDIDNCVSDGCKIHPFAQEIVETVASYTEISPSGTGIRIFAKGDLPFTGKKIKKAWTGGVTMSAIEYLTNLMSPEPAVLSPQSSASVTSRPSGLDDETLLEKATKAKNGAVFQRLMNGDWTGYPSQSEADDALMGRLAWWTGNNPDQMRRLFCTSGLYTTIARKPNQDAYINRTIQHAISKTTDTYQPRQKKQRVARPQRVPEQAQQAGDGRTAIKWDDSQIHVIIETVQDILVDKWQRGETPILYRRPEGVVRIGKVDRNSVASSFGVRRDADSLMLYQVEAAWLHAYFTEIIAWEKFSLKNGWIATSCPKAIVELFLAKKGELRIPFLSGIVTAPIMRPDGTTLDTLGYDNDTGLFFDPCGIDWPKVMENPTRADALAACTVLLDLVSEFPFKTEAGRSVALAYILTCLIRRILPTAPGFGFSATMPGTGKTYLANVGSIIASGCDADLMAPPEDEAEMHKCLTALLIEGSHAIIIDNVMRTFFSAKACAMLTSATMSGRILGQSKMPKAAPILFSP